MAEPVYTDPYLAIVQGAQMAINDYRHKRRLKRQRRLNGGGLAKRSADQFPWRNHAQPGLRVHGAGGLRRTMNRFGLLGPWSRWREGYECLD